MAHNQGISGLDYWIAQSGLQSNLVDWIVIYNPKSKSDFGFGLDCQSILKIEFGFGLSITYLWWIWIGLDWQSKKIGLSNSLHTTKAI